MYSAPLFIAPLVASAAAAKSCASPSPTSVTTRPARQDIVRAARKIDPKEIQKWSAVVDGGEFPVKQLLMEAANMIDSAAPRVTPADFIAHYAVRKLKRLGFVVKYYETHDRR